MSGMTEHTDRQKQLAAAIADTLIAFERQTQQEGLGMLGYLIQMARLEAQTVASES